MEVIKVFLASPGDVPEEREIVRNIVEEENHNHFTHEGYRLEVVRWESHASPGIGKPHPQGRINPLMDECALFIGILWTRFGSPTGKTESGIKEEYNYALELLAKPDLPLCDMKVYFCDYAIKPSDIDPDQLKKVNEFKERIGKRNNILHWTVKEREEFKKLFRQHLADWFREYWAYGGKMRLSLIKGEPFREDESKIPLSRESLVQEFGSMGKGF